MHSLNNNVTLSIVIHWYEPMHQSILRVFIQACRKIGYLCVVVYVYYQSLLFNDNYMLSSFRQVAGQDSLTIALDLFKSSGRDTMSEGIDVFRSCKQIIVYVMSVMIISVINNTCFEWYWSLLVAPLIMIKPQPLLLIEIQWGIYAYVNWRW